MKLRQIKVDKTLRESIFYKDGTFPVDLCTDVFSMLIDRTMNCHWHSEFEFGVVVSGELDYYINGAYLKLRKGDCVFINANTMHMAKQSAACKDAAMFTLVFPPSLFADEAGSSIYQKYLRPLIGNSAINGFKFEEGAHGHIVLEVLEELRSLDTNAYGYELQCLGLIIRAWKATIDYIAEQKSSFLKVCAKNKNEGKVKDILTYIHRHYADTISVDEIARYAGVSRSACFRYFRRFANKNPVEYINDYRLVHAAKMLKETNDTVAEICNACGFSSSSYFGKLFKEKYAMTPLRYRHN